MSDFKVAYKTRNINSKRLLNEFKKVVEDVCDEYISRQHTLLDKTYKFDELVGFLEMYLEDMREKGIISQWDVIGDHRINTEPNIRRGIIKVLVSFRQTNCLNISQIEMTFNGDS
jgi:hypothetical protein